MREDSLGDRMKIYESETKYKIPRGSYTMIRLDGKAFHTFAAKCNKPFDSTLSDCMEAAMKYVLDNVQGALFGYTQSDEITILMTDFEHENKSAYFDGKIQKIASVTASMATAAFNRMLLKLYADTEDRFDYWKRFGLGEGGIFEEDGLRVALFDARVYYINPDNCEIDDPREEVINSLIWRQQDAIRNSISMAAQSKFSHKDLERKGKMDQIKMLESVGIDWQNNYRERFRRGLFMEKELYEKEPNVMRSRWITPSIPVFHNDKDFLRDRIPEIPVYESRV